MVLSNVVAHSVLAAAFKSFCALCQRNSKSRRHCSKMTINSEHTERNHQLVGGVFRRRHGRRV